MAIDFPNSPTVDDTFTVGEVNWVWNGTTWRAVGQPTPGRFVVSETAPIAPLDGTMWFNSAEAKSYVYYDFTWVELITAIAGPQGPEGPSGQANFSSFLLMGA